jgi:DNA polymerase V
LSSTQPEPPRSDAGKNACRVVIGFIRTSPFIPNEPQYLKTLSVELPNPTDDTRDLLEVAEVLFRRIYRAGYRYAKGGVMLADFYEHGAFQQDLFRLDSTKLNTKALMTVVGKINQAVLQRLLRLARRVTTMVNEKRAPIASVYDKVG